MATLLKSMLLGSIVSGKVQSILAKRRNRLITVVNEKTLTVNFDIIKSWSYESSVKLTENPVEQGVMTNDHRIIQPNKLTMEVGVSNVINPINTLAQGGNLLQASKILLLGSFGMSIANSPIEATWSLLETIKNNSELFDVETPVRTFKNMLILSIKSKNDNNTYGTFEGTLELQEFITYDGITKNTEKSGINERVPINNQTIFA